MATKRLAAGRGQPVREEILPEACDKKALRAAARARRDALAPQLRARHSAAIVSHLSEWLLNQPRMRQIGLYAALGSEVDLRALALWCTDHGRCALMPRLGATASGLGFVRIDAQTQWEAFKGRLMQPLGPAIGAAKLDLVLVPGLLFDPAGFRLGYGGGHFDRALSGTKVAKVGVCYRMQRVACLPHEAHDVPVDAIVDQSGLCSCTRS